MNTVHMTSPQLLSIASRSADMFLHASHQYRHILSQIDEWQELELGSERDQHLIETQSLARTLACEISQQILAITAVNEEFHTEGLLHDSPIIVQPQLTALTASLVVLAQADEEEIRHTNIVTMDWLEHHTNEAVLEWLRVHSSVSA